MAAKKKNKIPSLFRAKENKAAHAKRLKARKAAAAKREAGGHWFHDMTPAAKKAYLAKHPTSQFGKLASTAKRTAARKPKQSALETKLKTEKAILRDEIKTLTDTIKRIKAGRLPKDTTPMVNSVKKKRARLKTINERLKASKS